MIRVVIIDADEIVHAGLKTILSSTADIEVVGEKQNVRRGFNILGSVSADVLITELSATSRRSMDLISRAKHLDTALPVLILAAQDNVEFAVRALRAGASGVLAKDATASQIIIAVRRVAKGDLFVSDQIAAQFMSQIKEIEPTRGHKALTNRELDVFVRIAQGETSTGIARALSLSPKTISTHKSRIMEKLHLVSTAGIVQYAVAHQLIPALIV
jgi:DNA-binding NarL/FixJ family response regulator